MRLDVRGSGDGALHPWVLAYLGRLQAGYRVLGDHFGHKVDSVRVKEVDFALSHGRSRVPHDPAVPNVSGLVERLLRSKHHEEHDARCKGIHGRPVVLGGGPDLGRHVVLGAALGTEDLGSRALEYLHEAEVGDLEVHVLVEEAVLELEVAMGHAVSVHVLKAIEELGEQLPTNGLICFVFLEAGGLLDVIEELTIGAIFRHNEILLT